MIKNILFSIFYIAFLTSSSPPDTLSNTVGTQTLLSAKDGTMDSMCQELQNMCDTISLSPDSYNNDISKKNIAQILLLTTICMWSIIKLFIKDNTKRQEVVTEKVETRDILNEMKKEGEKENLNATNPQPTASFETQTPTINMETNTLHTDYPNPYLNITNTADLVKAVMKNLGFLYEEFEDYPGLLFVKCQGENLIIDCNRGAFILILDQAWYSAPLSDLEQVSAVQKAVNNVNDKFLPGCIYYRIDKEEGTIDV